MKEIKSIGLQKFRTISKKEKGESNKDKLACVCINRYKIFLGFQSRKDQIKGKQRDGEEETHYEIA